MLRSLLYALFIYFGFLAILAYGLVNNFFYWFGVCGGATLFGTIMGTTFGSLHLRESEEDSY